MPIYDYVCPACSNKFDVTNRIGKMKREEPCPDCETISPIVPSRFSFYGAKVEEAEFNHGLGCVTKNSKDRAEKAKKLGLEEVGNYDVQQKHKDLDRNREQAREAVWDSL